MRPAATALLLAVLLPLPGLAGEVVVKPGETLSELAERYGTTTQRLMQLNGLRSPQDLWAGSRIRVPGAAGGGGSSSRVAGVSGGNYTVKPGETLSEIADRYGTTTERLMQLNGLRSGKDLWAGSRIQVPGASPARPSSATKPALNRNARQHEVQPGETLSEIADRYGIPMSRLVALNGLAKPDDLQAGSTLKLRDQVSAAKPPVRPATRPAAATQSASRPSATTTTARPSVAAAKPTTKPTTVATAASATTSATTSTSTSISTTTPSTARPAATSPAPRPATATVSTATSVATAKPSKPATPDWRSYGPLQVDWANWQPMAGSYVAPSLNSDGQPLYLAVNCTARRLNATGQSGTWKTWDAPQNDFEKQLISDLCKAKGV